MQETIIVLFVEIVGLEKALIQKVTQKWEKRSIYAESVFGMIKNNQYFKRFILRRLPKVKIK